MQYTPLPTQQSIKIAVTISITMLTGFGSSAVVLGRLDPTILINSNGTTMVQKIRVTLHMVIVPVACASVVLRAGKRVDSAPACPANSAYSVHTHITSTVNVLYYNYFATLPVEYPPPTCTHLLELVDLGPLGLYIELEARALLVRGTGEVGALVHI